MLSITNAHKYLMLLQCCIFTFWFYFLPSPSKRVLILNHREDIVLVLLQLLSKSHRSNGLKGHMKCDTKGVSDVDEKIHKCPIGRD